MRVISLVRRCRHRLRRWLARQLPAGQARV